MFASSSRHALRAGKHGLANVAAPRTLLASTQASSSQRRTAAAQAVRSATSGSAYQPFAPGRSNRPFDYRADPTFKVGNKRGSELARANMELGRLVEDKRAVDAFKLGRSMKSRGLRPDRTTFDCLLTACKDLAFIPEAWAVLEDMVACGIQPDRNAFHSLLLTVRYEHYDIVNKVWDLMLAHNIKPNEGSYEILIGYLTRNQHLELALQKIGEMSQYGLSPSLRTAQQVISLACEFGHPRLAIELATAFESSSVRRLDAETWMKCLIASSDMLYADGVTAAWAQAVKKMQIHPDEGCCINVLHTAGRHGLSSLALEVMEVLKAMQVTWDEHHFAPLIEALCRDGDFREAFGVLSLMRDHDIQPSLETAYPIFEVISESVDTVDDAYGVLDSTKQDGNIVDISALNVVIQACIALGDLQRALGMYKAASDLGVTPNIETYNLLLSACIRTSHRELGDRILNEMRVAGVQPDVRTYERLVVLCLTQTNYEHAFYYLEEMKSRNLRPTVAIYEAIIRKCFSVGDTRHQLAMEEMVEQGYEVSGKLKAFMEGGVSGPYEPRARSFKPRAEGKGTPSS